MYCASILSTSGCANAGCSSASENRSIPRSRSLVRNSPETVLKSAPASAPKLPPIKSRSSANFCALRLAVPLRSSPAVTAASPSSPAGSATEPAFTIAARSIIGTPCFSISSNVKPFFRTTFSCGGSFNVCAPAICAPAAGANPNANANTAHPKFRKTFTFRFIALRLLALFPEAAWPLCGYSRRNIFPLPAARLPSLPPHNFWPHQTLCCSLQKILRMFRACSPVH